MRPPIIFFFMVLYIVLLTLDLMAQQYDVFGHSNVEVTIEALIFSKLKLSVNALAFVYLFHQLTIE